MQIIQIHRNVSHTDVTSVLILFLISFIWNISHEAYLRL